MECEKIRELFGEALYGELPAGVQREFDAHLATCVECSREFGKLRETLSIMDRRERVEPAAGFAEKVWKSVSSEIGLHNEEAGERVTVFRKAEPRHFRIPAWSYAIAATVLLAVGIYLGRTYFTGPEAPELQTSNPLAAALTGQPEDSVTTQAVAYLERSRNLLLGLANLDPEHRGSIDLGHKQEISRQLVEQGTALTVSLNRPNQQQLRRLVADLEVILLQLANIEVKPGVPAVEMVQKGIDQKSILLKINLEEMRAMANRPQTDQKTKRTL